MEQTKENVTVPPGAPEHKKPSTWGRGRIVLLIAAALVITAVFANLAWRVQYRVAVQTLHRASEEMLGGMQDKYDTMLQEQQAAATRFDELYQGRANAAAQFLALWQQSSVQAAETAGEGAAIPLPDYTELEQRLRVQAVYWLDASGAPQNGSPRWAYSGEADTVLYGRFDPLTVGDTRFYAAACGSGRVVLAVDAGELNVTLDPVWQVGYFAGNVQFGDSGTMMAIDTADDTFACFGPGGWTGSAIAEAGLQPDTLYDGFAGWCSIGEDSYYTVCRLVGERFLFGAITDRAAVVHSAWQALVAPAFVYLLVVLALLIYAVLLLRDVRHGGTAPAYRRLGHFSVGTTLARKLLPVAGAGMALVFGVTFYAHTLYALSVESLHSNARLVQAEQSLLQAEQNQKDLQVSMQTQWVAQAHLVGWMIREQPEMLAQTNIAALAQNLGVDRIDIFDETGRAEVSSTEYQRYSLSTEPEDSSYAFWSLLYGDQVDLFVPAGGDQTDSYTAYAGTLRTDTVGIVRLLLRSDAAAHSMELYSSEKVVEAASLSTDGLLFTVNTSDGMLRDTLRYDWQGDNATEIGLEETALEDDYIGYQQIDQQTYFVHSEKYGDVYIYAATRLVDIQRYRLAVSLFNLGASFVLVLALVGLTVFHVGTPAVPPAARQTGSEKTVTVTLPGGKTRQIRPLDLRWNKTLRTWGEKTPEEKFRSVLGWLVSACVAAAALLVFAVGTREEANSILNYILVGKWERGLNVFAFTRIAMVFAVVLVISWVLRHLASSLARSLGSHAETIGYMVNGCIKYAAIIGAGFYSLNLLGIQTATLVTSASVATVVLGLGAQSLIGDILAGVFIVLEGEFRVGDIVTIDDWRGTVVEIGVRTTKVEDVFGNIKVFNNTSISGVVNMTQKYSVARCNISVDYGADLRSIEEVLHKNFPEIRKRLPAIRKGPFYDGVIELGDSAVVLRVSAQCAEEKRVTLEWDLNREIKLLFDENHINIPYPQLVIHQAPPDA